MDSVAETGGGYIHNINILLLPLQPLFRIVFYNGNFFLFSNSLRCIYDEMDNFFEWTLGDWRGT